MFMMFRKGNVYPRPPHVAISRPPSVNFRNTANKKVPIVTVVILYIVLHSMYIYMHVRSKYIHTYRIFLSATSQFPLVKPREWQLYLTIWHTLYYFPHLLPSMDFTAEYTDGPMSEVGIFTGISASEHEEHRISSLPTLCCRHLPLGPQKNVVARATNHCRAAPAC